MTLSLRHLSSLSGSDELDRETLAAQLEVRIDALAQVLSRHRERLSGQDQGEIQIVLDRGHMDLGKSPAVLIETARYVGRFHRHILLKLSMS